MMPILVVLLLLLAIVFAVVDAFYPPPHPRLGWLAVACIAGVLLIPAIQAL